MNGNGRNWRTTLGGACGATGALILGSGFLSGYLEVLPKKFVVGMIAAGIILECLGKFFSSLFAADAKTVDCLRKQVDQNTQDVSDLKGNTPPPIPKP